MTADLRAWPAPRRTAVLRVALLLAVLTVAVAVTAMHAMGAGHAGATMSTVTSASPMGLHHGHGGTARPLDDGPVLQPATDDHGMGAMCLAVLPLLVLALAHALHRWRRAASGAPQDAVRRPVVTSRAPPPHLAPDLTGLGISRT